MFFCVDKSPLSHLNAPATFPFQQSHKGPKKSEVNQIKYSLLRTVPVHSVMSSSFVTPRTVAHQAPLSVDFSRQDYWSELSLPTPGELPHPGIEPLSFESPALTDGFFTTRPLGSHWELLFLIELPAIIDTEHFKCDRCDSVILF